MSARLQVCLFMCILVTTVAWGEDNSALSFRLGDTVVSNTRFILDLGIQVENREQTVQLFVRNSSKADQQLDAFKSSQWIDVRWSKSDDEHGLRSRINLRPGDEQVLVVRVMPSSKEDQAPVIIFVAGKSIVASFGISYTIDMAEKTEKTGGEFWSPYGLEGQQMTPKAWYKLCTGATPTGYRLKANSLAISAHTVEGSHERNCGSWMDCNPLPPEADGNACYSFGIEGHWKGANLSHGDENERVKVAVEINWVWEIADQTPKLVAF
jgi:hypothetical protein